jgi:membrane protein
MENIKFETVLIESTKLPMVKIDRELFLRKELRDRYTQEIVEKAIQYNPAYAGICVEDINKIAKSCIAAETIKVTALSAAAGLPGGLAIIGTIPVDLAQYFGHILRILQKLIYLYGWSDLRLDSKELNDETMNFLTLFIGIMFGVNGAVGTVNKLTVQVAKQIVKKLPQKTLTKGMIYPIVKKIATLLGVRMTKQIFARGVAKVIPILGAVASGGLTFITFKPMSEKLREYLESGELASVEYYKKKTLETVIEVETPDI